MDAEEKEIVDFLKSWPGQFVGSREIAKRAGGKWRYRENPNWASPVLIRMVEQQILETDSCGHYRLAPEKKERDKKKWWVSPDNKKTLDESGRQFDGLVTEIPEEDEE